jgi:hypothetical protein
MTAKPRPNTGAPISRPIQRSIARNALPTAHSVKTIGTRKMSPCRK